MSKIHVYIAMIMMAVGGFSVSASTLRLMPVEAVSALLDSRESASVTGESPAAMAVISGSGENRESMPRIVNAVDIISRVYGAVNPASGREGCRRYAESMEPGVVGDENGNIWLDSADGYSLSYCGIAPEMSAMASFGEDDSVEEFCYFFLFPYSESTKPEATRQQAGFTGSLLQEMLDFGCDPGVNTESDDLMEVCGVHDGDLVNVRLIDDSGSTSGASRYILMVIVEPEAFSSADDVAAL